MEIISRKAIATGILLTIFTGLSTALASAFMDVNALIIKHRAMSKRVERIEVRTEKRLERIEKKIDHILGAL